MEIIIGNLLEAKEDYIVQQNCCIACRPHGLSADIAKKFPSANPYKLLIPMKKGGNTATESTRYTPGTCKIFENHVVCLFGQYSMGKPGKYESFGVPDTAKDRLAYFKQALDDMASQIPNNASIGFPYKIGCGLAGGKWCDYIEIIENFSIQHPEYKIVIYKLS